jgi:PST family polysaccharide transporter/lipopolysaccharide exporter
LNPFRKLARFAFAEEGSVKARVVRSGIWVGASNAIGSLLNVVRSIALARLLSPEMFGLMGLAGIAIRTLETVTRPGVAQALIARQKAFDEAAATAFTMLMLRGFVLAALLAAVAPWAAKFYEAGELEPILQVLAAVFVIGGLVNIRTIAHQKELDFRRLTYLGLTTNVLGTLATIAAAFWLRSVWALVIGQLVTASLNALLSYVFVGGRLHLAWDKAVARELFAYGKFITGSSIILFVATEIDSAVIGKVLGVEQLGFYTLAFTIANIPTANLSKIAAGIMMPAYSKLQADRPALQRAFLRTQALVMLVVLPASAGIVLAAEPLLAVVYGNKWLPATIPLQLLAVFGLVRSLAAFNGYLFEGMSRPKVAFQLGVLRLLVVVPLIVPATARWGLAGAAATVTLGIAAQWMGGFYFLRRELDLGPWQVLSNCWRSVWTTAIMGAAVYATMSVVPHNSIVGLLLIITSGVAVYGVLNFKVLRALMAERMA